jgi:4-diphosphocytidyl-2-C-methyl-D-erythritol kinase
MKEVGAGLGGGSADAAHMLLLLNRYTGAGLNPESLSAISLELGSDCPYFLYNQPAFAQGRGEILTPVALNLDTYVIVLVLPSLHISTREAFSLIRPKPASFDLRSISELAIGDWKDVVSNDFETPVLQRYPQLAIIKKELYDKGALYAAMSGSGSTLYGIFNQNNKPELQLPDGATTVFCDLKLPGR